MSKTLLYCIIVLLVYYIIIRPLKKQEVIKMDKSFLFIILGLGCFWLVLDQIKGKKLIGAFTSELIGG